MHFRQKLIFMALGSILTIAGYLVATLTSDVPPQARSTDSSNPWADDLETDLKTLKPIVYITATGKKYHRKECEFGYTKTTLEEAKQAGLKPCKICKPPR